MKFAEIMRETFKSISTTLVIEYSWAGKLMILFAELHCARNKILEQIKIPLLFFSTATDN